MKLNRIVIYAQDIQRITGRSRRYAQRKLQEIREDIGKKKHQLVTYEEFCKHTGMDEENVKKYLQ